MRVVVTGFTKDGKPFSWDLPSTSYELAYKLFWAVWAAGGKAYVVNRRMAA